MPIAARSTQVRIVVSCPFVRQQKVAGDRLTFEEWDHVNQPLVTRSAVPFGNDDGILGLKRRVIRVGVEQDDL